MTRLALFVCLLCLSWTSSAFGASGWLSGTLKFKQIQGNFCDTAAGQDCLGARYRDTEFNTNQPIRGAKVAIVNDDTGSTIGSGTTGVSGGFFIQWSATTLPSTITVRVKYEHKDGRFAIRSYSNGAVYYTNMRTVVPVDGTTDDDAQEAGTRITSTSIASLYDGAYRAWTDAFAFSTAMVNRFTGVKIRAYDADCSDPNSADCECPTSCANGANKTVIISTSEDTKRPIHRIMHELGHVANYLSKPYVGVGSNGYAFPHQSCLGDCRAEFGWSMTSMEWGSAQFEEAMATFHGIKALYGVHSPEPMQCFSSLGCYSPSSSQDVEFAPASASCVAKSPIQALRFFWDVYDAHADVAFSDTLALSYGTFTATMDSYPEGTNNHENNEPWQLGLISTDDMDGRGPHDFYYNLLLYKGQPLSPPPASYSNVYTGNCTPN